MWIFMLLNVDTADFVKLNCNSLSDVTHDEAYSSGLFLSCHVLWYLSSSASSDFVKMSSQKGNASRSRGQKHQNTTAYKNDKYGASVQVKIANSKVHDGLCQRCKEVIEWKVKYNKYKSLTQPRTCVKCSQKTVKDAYHVICKPCALKLELCAKCGKKENIVIPLLSLGVGRKWTICHRSGVLRPLRLHSLDSMSSSCQGWWTLTSTHLSTAMQVQPLTCPCYSGSTCTPSQWRPATKTWSSPAMSTPMS
uniref:Guanine deaminase n=1 Tax=Hucho hucho TaxID=62062 RepID=A0A4W5QKD1_9TELE